MAFDGFDAPAERRSLLLERACLLHDGPQAHLGAIALPSGGARRLLHRRDALLGLGQCPVEVLTAAATLRMAEHVGADERQRRAGDAGGHVAEKAARAAAMMGIVLVWRPRRRW